MRMQLLKLIDLGLTAPKPILDSPSYELGISVTLGGGTWGTFSQDLFLDYPITTEMNIVFFQYFLYCPGSSP